MLAVAYCAARFIPLEVSHFAPPSVCNPRLTICASASGRAPVTRVLAQAVISGWRLTLVAFVQSAVRFDLMADSLDSPRAFSRLALRTGPCSSVRRGACDVFGSKGPFVPQLFVAPHLYPEANRYSVKLNTKGN